MHKKLLLIIGIFLIIITSYSIITKNNNDLITLDSLNVFTLQPLKNNINGQTIGLKDIFTIEDWTTTTSPLLIKKVHQQGFLITKVYKGVVPLPDVHFITVVSNGYGSTLKRWWRGIPSQKAPIVSAYNDYKHDTISSPCVVSDYLKDRAHFTFGQDIETNSLELIYNTTHQRNLNAHIIVMGNCLGARAALYCAAKNPPSLAALVVQSPFISLSQLATDLSKSYVSWFPGSQPILNWLFPTWFYKYKPEDDNLLQAVPLLAKELPIFIAHLFNDTHVNNQSMFELVKTIRDSGHHHLYFFTLNSPTKKVVHGRLQETKPYAQALNAFYEKHNLPYDPALAKQGKQLLQDAYHNAHTASVNDWKVVNY